MVLTTNASALDAARKGPAFGPAVWGWGLWSGIVVWAAGFYFLPWWAALLIWWWPSLMVAAGVGFVAVGIASLLARPQGATETAAGETPGASRERPER